MSLCGCGGSSATTRAVVSQGPRNGQQRGGAADVGRPQPAVVVSNGTRGGQQAMHFLPPVTAAVRSSQAGISAALPRPPLATAAAVVSEGAVMPPAPPTSVDAGGLVGVMASNATSGVVMKSEKEMLEGLIITIDAARKEVVDAIVEGLKDPLTKIEFPASADILDRPIRHFLNDCVVISPNLRRIQRESDNWKLRDYVHSLSDDSGSCAVRDAVRRFRRDIDGGIFQYSGMASKHNRNLDDLTTQITYLKRFDDGCCITRDREQPALVERGILTEISVECFQAGCGNGNVGYTYTYQINKNDAYYELVERLCPDFPVLK